MSIVKAMKNEPGFPHLKDVVYFYDTPVLITDILGSDFKGLRSKLGNPNFCPVASLEIFKILVYTFSY